VRGVYLAVIPVTVVGVALGDLEMTWDVAATAALFGRVVVAMVLLSALGVAVGAAIGNRTVALVAVLVWFTLAEDLVGALLHVDRHLPSAAVRSLVSAGQRAPPPHRSQPRSSSPSPSQRLSPPWRASGATSPDRASTDRTSP
jgi:hypothetical protein